MHPPTQKSTSGFTIVEIIVVVVVLGILVGLVTNAFGGLQDDARDSERETDVQALSSELESYYSDYGVYPSLANVLDSAWVTLNLTGINADTLIDARGNTYNYEPSPINCDNLASNTECESYILTADLESDGYGVDDEDSDTEDILEKSIHNGQ